jgi:hypothetical protein
VEDAVHAFGESFIYVCVSGVGGVDIFLSIGPRGHMGASTCFAAAYLFGIGVESIGICGFGSVCFMDGSGQQGNTYSAILAGDGGVC